MNYIARIKDAEGNWLEAIKDIKRSTVEFFLTLFSFEWEGRQLLKLPFPLPQVSEADNVALSALPDMEELKTVVFVLSADSAPRPDGFGASFYQSR